MTRKLEKEMQLAIKRACENDSLTHALADIAVWEAKRAARHNLVVGSETFFYSLFSSVEKEFAKKQERKSEKRASSKSNL